MAFPHRYLTSFGPKDTPHLFTDVLIIGAGIAGIRAALEVPPEFRVLLVTKDRVQQSNSAGRRAASLASCRRRTVSRTTLRTLSPPAPACATAPLSIWWCASARAD